MEKDLSGVADEERDDDGGDSYLAPEDEQRGQGQECEDESSVIPPNGRNAGMHQASPGNKGDGKKERTYNGIPPANRERGKCVILPLCERMSRNCRH